MSTVIEKPIVGELVNGNAVAIDFEVTDTDIADVRSKCVGIIVRSNDDRKLAAEYKAKCVKLRTGVERKRKELLEDVRKYESLVNSEAKRITSIITEFEEPLKLEIAKFDEAKEKAKAEAEQAKRAKIEKRLADLTAVGLMVSPLDVAEWDDQRFFDELRDATIAHEEKQRKAAEEKAERERVAAEQAELIRIEREKIEAERAELARLRAAEEERQRAEQLKIAEANRLERQRLDEEAAKLRADRERIELEEHTKREALRIQKEQEAAAARAEAMKPDVEKIRAFAERMYPIALPACVTDEAIAFVNAIGSKLQKIGESCEAFGS